MRSLKVLEQKTPLKLSGKEFHMSKEAAIDGDQ